MIAWPWIVGGVAAFVLLTRWAWNRIPTMQCPRCHSYNVTEHEDTYECNGCDYEWGIIP